MFDEIFSRYALPVLSCGVVTSIALNQDALGDQVFKMTCPEDSLEGCDRHTSDNRHFPCPPLSTLAITLYEETRIPGYSLRGFRGLKVVWLEEGSPRREYVCSQGARLEDSTCSVS
ncbi:hypothetical protein CPC08DRAFT_137558 [Agrocybe pediades]|nr:hypothetical protein CPC08DRAFT_137558 [Agrocybe pediades]